MLHTFSLIAVKRDETDDRVTQSTLLCSTK